MTFKRTRSLEENKFEAAKKYIILKNGRVFLVKNHQSISWAWKMLKRKGLVDG